MKLYGSLTSPYVRKVRILVQEKNLPCEFMVQNPNEGPVAELNPLGKVPVMARDNGKVLYDSALIVEYLDSLGESRFIPASGEARWDVLLWHTLAMGVVDATVARLMETRRPADKQMPAAIAKQEEKIARGLDAAERSATGEFLVGETFGLADISLGVALEYIDLRYPHDWRTRHPRLAAWLAHIGARKSFKDTLPPEMASR